MKLIDISIISFTMIASGLATSHLINENKRVNHELLCKQVYEIKSKHNIVLECIEVSK